LFTKIEDKKIKEMKLSLIKDKDRNVKEIKHTEEIKEERQK